MSFSGKASVIQGDFAQIVERFSVKVVMILARDLMTKVRQRAAGRDTTETTKEFQDQMNGKMIAMLSFYPQLSVIL